MKEGGNATFETVNPPLKWHPSGGKAYLAKRIVALFPKHTTYCEPFAGGLSVLLAKDYEGISEVANDLDGDLMNFWRCLRDEETFARLQRKLEATPFNELDWAASLAMVDAPPADDVVRAWGFFVRCRQSLAGRMESFAPLSRSRVRRGMNEQASAWLSAIEGLPAVHARLKRVVTLNRPALEVIRTQDHPDCLFYVDSPYFPSTRTAKEVYRHEMTEIDHVELLTTILEVKAKVAISGYQCPLYDAKLADWNRHDFEIGNHSASGATKRRMIESVWCNF